VGLDDAVQYCASNGTLGGQAFGRRGGVLVLLDGLGELGWDAVGIGNVVTGRQGVG